MAVPGTAPVRPAALVAIPAARRVSLDVRAAIRSGEEPFAEIMAAVAGLAADQVLVLRTPFEPRPLYRVLGKRGFASWTEQGAEDDWSVWFYRGDCTASPAAPTPAARTADTIDVRGLEPPQPMVAVLERIERLGPGQTLTVVHDRRPTFLYPQIEARGYVHRTDEPEPGVVRIVIERPQP